MGGHPAWGGPFLDHKIPIYRWDEGGVSRRHTIKTVLQAPHDTGGEINEAEGKNPFAPVEVARLPGMALNFALEPGDLQIANNLSTLHQRTEYVDFEEPEKKRHLLRLWLASNQARPLAADFEERFNGGWSFRKGIPVTRT